jgi:hypothetical protein
LFFAVGFFIVSFPFPGGNMKKAFLFTAICMIAALHAKTISFNDQLKVVPLSHFTVTQLQEFILSHDSGFVLELQEGSSFPVQFLTKTPFISAMIDPNLTIKIEKTCYLRIAHKKLYMSEDLIHWEKANKMLDGRPSFQLSPSQNQGLVVESHLVPDQYEKESSLD